VVGGTGDRGTSALRFIDAANAYQTRQLVRPAHITGIRTANLTRRQTRFPSNQTVFTAIDLEMTGLDPDVDRIVEIVSLSSPPTDRSSTNSPR
jgi:DNA polymerase III epsilon subunit-like protein